MSEKHKIINQTEDLKKKLCSKIHALENEIETARRQIAAAVCGAEVKKDKIEGKIDELQCILKCEKEKERVRFL